MSKIGYARVSSKEQNLDRQLEQLEKYGCDKVFKEKVSGKNINDRTELLEMLDFIREDDEVVVISLDRLGRNNEDIDKIITSINETGATFTILDLPCFSGIQDKNLRKLLNTLVLELFKYTAQSEREKIRERQTQGIEIAKRKGKYKGGTIKYSENSTGKNLLIYNTVIEELEKGTPLLRISKKVGISRNTVKSIQSRLD